ncbi:transposase [Pandoraea horticolens]|uniref:Transposase n=1 Tax=Pandoraea horticolens TaxID=2508298 RepID=A0A5E4XKC0_9BURK|nr:transposase [Pandoraea horticolens]
MTVGVLSGNRSWLNLDDGPEFVSTALLKWAVQGQVATALIDPGKPRQNDTNERFNKKFRDECSSMAWFRNRIEAKIVIENWRTHYNEVRPHSSLQYLTLAEFRRVSKRYSTAGAVNL